MNFLDWQFAHYTSPAIDVLFYLFNSTDKEFRDQNFLNLLRFYQTELRTAIGALGSDPHALCSEASLERDYKKFGSAILVLVTFSLGFIWIDDPTEDGSSNDEYRRHIIDFASDMIKYGYIDCSD